MDWEFITRQGYSPDSLVGMTGMGGGSLMTPILVFLFGIYSPSTAIGTDIAHGAVLQDGRSSSAPAHRQRSRTTGRLDADRVGANVACSGCWFYK